MAHQDSGKELLGLENNTVGSPEALCYPPAAGVSILPGHNQLADGWSLPPKGQNGSLMIKRLTLFKD